jgi:hypothetical protein
MKRYYSLIIAGVLLLTAGVFLMAEQPVQAQDAPATPEFLQGIYEAWSGSGHADATAEAFIHWDSEGAVPARCATCHATPGLLDFLGADGSAVGTVDADAPLGTTVNCDACHNAASASLTAVTFPSGATVSEMGDSTRCMICHQGRASAVQVEAKLTELNLTEDLDTSSPDLSFINIHYYAAAASIYGSEVQGGYQYAGNSYEGRFWHVEGYDTCASCHNPHTLEIEVAECQSCHEVESAEELASIRMPGSLMDYDGDGDVEEGIAGEIATLQETLYAAIQAYAANVVGTPIAYDVASHPYFFIDTNANGVADPEEVNGDNRYNVFTARLMQAAYNYQVTLKDPGNYAHNAKYHIQLLFDSITSLNSVLVEPIDMSSAHRNDAGHFDGTTEAWRHWDEDGAVPGSCARCHSAEGLPTYLAEGVNISAPVAQGMSCTTCHNDLGEFTLYPVAEVSFPSGAKVSFGEEEPSNMCLNCHQGRESTVSVNSAIGRAGVGDDEVSDALNFRNPHYFASGATLMGTEVKGAYEYEGMEYNGRFEHVRRLNTCDGCHDVHTLTLVVEECADCHDGVETAEDAKLIRLEQDDVEAVDYDGDGDATEPVADEIMTLENDLMTRMQAYAIETTGTAIVYNPGRYPYFFIDANGNGTADPDEGDRFVTWTPRLLRAAYNYKYVGADPGGYAHNADYILQVLFDSLQDIGGPDAVASYNRPPVRAME